MISAKQTSAKYNSQKDSRRKSKVTNPEEQHPESIRMKMEKERSAEDAGKKESRIRTFPKKA